MGGEGPQEAGVATECTTPEPHKFDPRRNQVNLRVFSAQSVATGDQRPTH